MCNSKCKSLGVVPISHSWIRRVLCFAFLWIQMGLSFAQDLPVIPYPEHVSMHEGNQLFILDRNTTISCQVGNYEEARYLRDNLAEFVGRNLEIVEATDKTASSIELTFDNTLTEEAYRFEVDQNQVTIFASNSAGWFYGIQTLLQLVTYNKANDSKIKLSAMTINDGPRFKWRAFMLDEARYFKGKEHVKLLLDEMARLKMNVFHWHLTDDAGWRIEIKKYPKLTEIGAYRKSTRISKGKRWNSQVESGVHHGGFYTHAEIREILAYAEARHITVVPEIEMPGHASAAIAAYPWLGTKNRTIEVPTRFGVFEDVYNVTDPQVYQFLVDVLDEVMALFPSPVIHIGGDEIKYEQWKNSDQVQAYMRENSINSAPDLHVFFTNKIAQYISSQGRRMMGWNDIMGHQLHHYQEEDERAPEVKLASETVIHFWKGDIELMTNAIEDGFEVVNSVHTHTYLDYDHGTTPLSKAYHFDPIPEGLNPQYHPNVVGTGCQIWSEWVPSIGELHYQVFPRIAAYAEVGWTALSQKNYARFRELLPAMIDRWHAKGVYSAPLHKAENKE